MSVYAMVDIVHQEIRLTDFSDFKTLEKRKTEIVKNICDHYKISLEVLLSRNAKADVRDARNLTMYCLHRVLRITAEQVGVFLCRNHATVLNGTKRTANWIETDKKYEQKVIQILNK